MSNNSNLFLSIGKPIKDEYGRTLGTVASFALTPSGKFDAVFIQFNNGKFSKEPMEHLQFNGAEVTFTSTVKSQASVLCDQIPLIWRKDQALKDLAEKRKISPDLYQELHNNFEGVLDQLKKDAETLIDGTAKEVARCDQEIKTLGYAVVNLELEHEVGQIDETAYKSAFAMLQENLKRANKEKSDIEATKSKLSNILLGDSKQPEQKTNSTSTALTDKKSPIKENLTEAINETPDEAPELPEPPVVVYVKEVGKAGI
jgi:chromosome segregation ATPase